jgi:hypothetical protein
MYLIQHDVVKFSIDWFTDYSLIRGGLYCTTITYLIQHDVVKFSIDWFTDYSLVRGGKHMMVPATNIDIFDGINQISCPGKVMYTFCSDMN